MKARMSWGKIIMIVSEDTLYEFTLIKYLELVR